MFVHLRLERTAFVVRAKAARAIRTTLLHALQGRRDDPAYVRRFLDLRKHLPAARRRRFLPIMGGSEPYLKIETEERTGAYVVSLSGEVDLETVTLLQGALDGRIHNSRNVILDCRQLTYMDSTGFNLLTSLYMQGRRFVLVAPMPAVQKILKITGLDMMIPVVPSVEAALAALTIPGKYPRSDT